MTLWVMKGLTLTNYLLSGSVAPVNLPLLCSPLAMHILSASHQPGIGNPLPFPKCPHHSPNSHHRPSLRSRYYKPATCCGGIRSLNLVSAVSRRNAIAFFLSSYIGTQLAISNEVALAEPSVGFREHIDLFDGYTFIYPKNWIQVRGAGADIFFRDPFILDENLSVELSSPSSSRYKSVEDLGPPEVAAEKVLKQYLTEFMSTRLGVRRESNIISTSSKVADDGRVYYQVGVNIKSYASNNELAVNPQDRVQGLEWDRRYLSVLGVENNRLYELRLQIPESMYIDDENELQRVMDSFRVLKAVG